MKASSIHKAHITDAAAIADMAQALAAYEGERSFADEAAMRAILTAECEPKCHCLVAKADESPVAFALYYAGYDLSSASYGFHLADLYVEEAHRNQGIATQLLSAIAAQAQAENREWISLTALKNNAAAGAFYSAQNFHKADVDFYAIGANGMRHLLTRG